MVLNKMSDWISVFDVWKENSPFLRRNLITRNGLFKWTEELGYISSKWEEKEFNILLDYLEEKGKE